MSSELTAKLESLVAPRALWRERRVLVRRFRKQMKLRGETLAKMAGISRPYLTQFEKGARKRISDKAWTRILAAIQKLLAEDEARRKQEREKAVQTAAKLTSIDEAKRKSDVEATTRALFTEVWGPVLSYFEDGIFSVSQAGVEKSLEQNARFQINKHIAPLVTQRNYWQEAFHSQAGVISELKARLAELEQKPGRGRTKKVCSKG